MKKYIASPLGSAVIVPGFGQVLNGQVKKGLILMGVVFLIFVAGMIKLVQVIMDILPGLSPDELNADAVLARVRLMDVSMLRVVIIVFLIVWIYSIIDAFIFGIGIEKERNKS